MNMKTKDSKTTNRPKRTPLHARNILEAKQRPGFARRWVNEEVDRIEQFQDAGWTIVMGDEDNSDNRAQKESQLGSVVRKVVNRKPNAPTATAVLMEIELEFYNEDQASKADIIAEKEKGFKPQNDAENYGEMKFNKS